MRLSRYLIIALLIVACSPTLQGQYDTLKPKLFSSLLFKIHEPEDGQVAVKSKAFPQIMSAQRINYLLNLLFAKESSEKLDQQKKYFSFDESISLDSCTTFNSDSHPCDMDFDALNLHFLFKGNLTITNCDNGSNESISFRDMICDSDFNYMMNNIPIVLLSNCTGLLNFDQNELSSLSIYGHSARTKDMYISYNTFTGSNSNVTIQDASYRGSFNMGNNEFQQLNVRFANDSFYDGISLHNSDRILDIEIGKHTHHHIEFYFSDCYFNSTIFCSENADTTIFKFLNCSFGPKAGFVHLNADSIEFNNCGMLPASVSLSLGAEHSSCAVNLENTSFNDVSFIYSPKTHLYFDSADGKDNYSNTFEGLLTKFKKENKPDSYERLDKEYQHFKARKGNSWEKFGDWCNRVWWSYGYSKSRVLLWTMFFLFIFSMFNAIFWKELQKVYPAPFTYPTGNPYYHRHRYLLKKIIVIFLYTALIFFSLRIKFEKLNFKSIFLGCFFLFQYLVGIGCLFFLINFILRL